VRQRHLTAHPTAASGTEPLSLSFSRSSVSHEMACK
jgi:hypothetical protein